MEQYNNNIRRSGIGKTLVYLLENGGIAPSKVDIIVNKTDALKNV